MTWFRRNAPRMVDDPVFGTLTLARGSDWEGKVASPTPGERLAVSIARPNEVPTAEDRKVFTEFVASYSLLVPALSSELFKLLDPTVRTPDWEGPSPRTADELWRMVRLEALHIQPGRPLELMFAFRDDIWPDAIFNLAVEGRDVRGLSLDD
jgi:hypothetical protein